MKVVIAGAGIGGLATAIAIGRAGHEVVVLERSPVLGEIGAGVALWPNGQRALEALGIELTGGLPVRRLELRSRRGHLLSETPVADLRTRYGYDLVLVHRAELHSLLLDALGHDRVGAGAEVVAVEEDATMVEVSLASGDRHRAAIMVGADGLRSVVRRNVLGDGEPRYSGATCWRGVAQFPIDDGRAVNWLGTGGEFGIFPLRDGRAYWFAVANRPEREAEMEGGRKADVLVAFESWPEPVCAVVAATADPDVLRNDLYDRPPARTWSKGRMTLVGDAAHPMLPNAAQGASQALEDAVALGEALAAHRYQQAFSAYEARRLKRANRFVGQSRATGRSIQSTSPIIAGLRNFLLANLPRWLFLNQLDRTIGSGLTGQSRGG
jgi:2-polyprenyl-6-methoxyphenol hydroxylase-like FAD-dependent oxidoreductase